MFQCKYLEQTQPFGWVVDYHKCVTIKHNTFRTVVEAMRMLVNNFLLERYKSSDELMNVVLRFNENDKKVHWSTTYDL